LRFFEPYLREDGTQVGSLDLLASKLLDLSKIFHNDSKTEIGVLETILSMFAQYPAHYPALLERVTMELCRKEPGLYAPPLAAGMSILYSMVPAMDISCWRQLIDMLSFHLINFEMAWPFYAHYANDMVDAERNEIDNTKLFIATFIDKCTRSAESSVVQKALPKSLHYLIPSTLPVTNCPIFGTTVVAPVEGAPTAFTYSPMSSISLHSKRVAIGSNIFTNGVPESILVSLKELAAELLELVESKEDADVIETWMETIRDVDDCDAAEGWRGGLFLQAILVAGKEILSATTKLFEKYKLLLRDLAVSLDDQKV
jgi:hypothetical protein